MQKQDCLYDPRYNEGVVSTNHLEYEPRRREAMKFAPAKKFHGISCPKRSPTSSKHEKSEFSKFSKICSPTGTLPSSLSVFNKSSGHHGSNQIVPWCLKSKLTKPQPTQSDRTKVMDQNVSPLLICSFRPKIRFNIPVKESIARTIHDAMEGPFLQATSNTNHGAAKQWNSRQRRNNCDLS